MKRELSVIPNGTKKLWGLVLGLVLGVTMIGATVPAAGEEEQVARLVSNGGERIKSGYTLTAELPEGVTGDVTEVEFQYLNNGEYLPVEDDQDYTDNQYIITNAMANKTMRAVIFAGGESYITNIIEVGPNLNHTDLSHTWNKPTEGAIVTTANDDKFSFTNGAASAQPFILLETVGDKTLLATTSKHISDPYYENESGDTTQRQILDISDSKSILYKANQDEFITKYILPTHLQNYLMDHLWETEVGSIGYEYSNLQNDTVVSAKIAPISATEYYQYKDKIGYNDNGRGIGMRTPTNATSQASEGKVEAILVLGGVCPEKTYTAYYDWRFVFWVDNDIFKNVKLNNVGSHVAQAVLTQLSIPDLLELGYTEEELRGYGLNTTYPMAENLSCCGLESVGSVLVAKWDYAHTGGIEAGEAEYQWFRANDNGEKAIEGATTERYMLTSADVGYQVYFRVVPKDINGGRGVAQYSPVTQLVAEGQVSLAFDTLSVKDNGTASIAYSIGSLGTQRYQAMLWTYAGYDIIDYQEADIAEDGIYVLETAKPGTDVYAVSIVIEASTGRPVFGLLANDKNQPPVQQFEGEKFQIIPDPVKETFALCGVTPTVVHNGIVHFTIENKESGQIIQRHAAFVNGGVLYKEFKMPQECELGSYIIKIYIYEESIPGVLEVYYSAKADKVAALEELSTAVTAQQFAEVLEKNIKILEITDRYVLEMSKTELAALGEKLVGNIYIYDDLSQFYSDLRYHAALLTLGKGGLQAYEAAEYYKDIFCFGESRMYDEYQELSNAKNVFALFQGAAVDSVEAARTLFEENILLELINTAPSYGKIKTYLEEYQEIIPFDLSVYESSDKTATALYLLEHGGSYRTMVELQSAIQQAKDAWNIKTSGQGGGSGSRSGGGSSSHGGAVYTTIEVETESSSGSTFPQFTGFTDIAQDYWAAQYIAGLKEKGIVSGDEKGHFNPDDAVTREEFVKMLVGTLGIHHDQAQCTFSDVPEGNWSRSFIASAVEQNMIKGIDETHFGFGQNLTRQDMAVIISRAATGMPVEKSVFVFADDSAIEDYAKEAVYQLTAQGIINGFEDGSFRPDDTATRAQAAKMICLLTELAE